MSVFEKFVSKFHKLNKPTSFNNEDDLYTFAHESFSSIADEIEKEIEINDDDYCDDEEWYDEYHDEVVQIYMKELTDRNKALKGIKDFIGKGGCCTFENGIKPKMLFGHEKLTMVDYDKIHLSNNKSIDLEKLDSITLEVILSICIKTFKNIPKVSEKVLNRKVILKKNSGDTEI